MVRTRELFIIYLSFYWHLWIIPNALAYFFVGLQAGSLATRAISHLHVTKENYLKWLLTEIKVAAILGLGMGLLIGLIAFQASGFDYGFGFVIFVANHLVHLLSIFLIHLLSFY